ncbi:MAG TPA: arylamine N-acetyltransferase [Hyphomicrobiales bacterium]|nr:arylamine N-acetyltransferase [Hyphomicrobiales bacterium]
MTLTPQQLAQYCHRIGYDGPLSPTLATLRALHELHPRAIPFENLDPWLGLPVSLEPEALFDKLVRQCRGGYCFEQNGLFALVLQTLGFSITGLSARVLWNQLPGAQPARTHRALLVAAQGQDWLVDVGFGGLTALAPLRLVAEREQRTPLETLRLRASYSGWILQVLLPQGERPVYWFNGESANPADFELSNWYVSTHPQSRFVQHLICSAVHGTARHNLLDRSHTIYRPGQPPQTRLLEHPDELSALLGDVFVPASANLPHLGTALQRLF